jgi:hypothetical protein
MKNTQMYEYGAEKLQPVYKMAWIFFVSNIKQFLKNIKMEVETIKSEERRLLVIKKGIVRLITNTS